MNRTFIALIFIGLLFAVGCSSNGDNSITAPPENVFDTDLSRNSAGRTVLAAGRFGIDQETMKAVFIPDRQATKHWDVTPMLMPPNCTDCIAVEIVELDPDAHTITLKVIIKNNTALTAYDVRGVIMPSVQWVFLTNPDSYTDLYAQGGTPHGFRAFATDQPQRQVGPYTSHARGFDFFFYGFDNLLDTGFVIDASWPSNCKEPYEISGGYSTGPFIENASSEIWVEVKSWNNDIELVEIDLSMLGYVDPVAMVHQYDDWYSITAAWQTGGGGPDYYNTQVSAKCAGSNLRLFGLAPLELQASPPTVGWAYAWGSSPTDAYDVVVDSQDSVYITGGYRWICDFDPTPGGSFEITSAGQADVFLTKFDSTGNYQWTASVGGTEYDEGYAVAVDDTDNVYITGYYELFTDFDPGPGAYELSSVNSEDAFLLKLDSAGSFQWVRTIGGPNKEHGYAIAIDGTDIYIGGDFADTVDFDPTAGVDERTAVKKFDGFISKYNTNGDYFWTVQIGGDNVFYGDQVNALEVDASGNVYAAGWVTGTSDFDPGPGVDEHISNGFYDAFLAKYSSAGDLIWAQTWGGGDWDRVFDIALDSTGEVYITGDFLETVDFDPGPGVIEITSNGAFDAFACRYDTDGNLVWVKTWGGSGDAWDRGAGIDVDSNNDLYLTGFYSGECDFGFGAGESIYTSLGLSDPFLVKLDNTGSRIWMSTWGGTSVDEPIAIDVDSASNSVVTGAFQGQTDFDPGMGYSPGMAGGFNTIAFVDKIGSLGSW